MIPAHISIKQLVRMQKSFDNIEEMMGDESFLAWFYKESDEKVKAWKNWLSENPVYHNMAAEAARELEALNTAEAPVAAFQIDAAYDKLNARLEEQDSDSVPVITMKPSRKRWWIGAAAAVLLLIAGITFFRSSSSKPVIETRYGQVRQQELPDGSEVMLNANTTVTLGNGWKEGDDREVWLKGEAFFHVKKTAQKNRFIVHTDQLDVIVTGTQFNVRTTGDKTSVLLTEGSVTIKTSSGQELLMQPGDFVEIQNNKAEKKTTNQETILAWRDNKLNFDKTPMREVAIMINTHYGVTVNLADDSIAEKTITGMMPNNNLEDLLNALEATADFKITRMDKTILIAKP
jgi:transmembrane sensor